MSKQQDYGVLFNENSRHQRDVSGKTILYAILFNPESGEYGFHFLCPETARRYSNLRSVLDEYSVWGVAKSKINHNDWISLVQTMGEEPRPDEDVDSAYLQQDLGWPSAPDTSR